MADISLVGGVMWKNQPKALIAIILLSFASANSAEAAYEWRRVTPHKDRFDCAQITSAGIFNRWADHSYCHGSEGFHYAWRDSKCLRTTRRCAEVTPSGGFIRWIDLSFCYSPR